MTPLAARPLDVAPDRAAEYERALAALPPGAVAAALAALDTAVARAEATGDVTPVRDTLDSLLVTARLQGNAAYLAAVADADAAELAGDDEPPEDVAAFVVRMRAEHQG
ncbi:MAG TPA: hypothetical protein VNA20_11660 [Frankiaceae bacterium]|nr:hypothetical protein [Frankiaceae bacterium]